MIKKYLKNIIFNDPNWIGDGQESFVSGVVTGPGNCNKNWVDIIIFAVVPTTVVFMYLYSTGTYVLSSLGTGTIFHLFICALVILVYSILCIIIIPFMYRSAPLCTLQIHAYF